jgi:membrane-bound metal-dependent hydrolase YbcI (DUF457 family)
LKQDDGKKPFCGRALFTAAFAPATSDILHLGLTPGELAVGVAIGMVAGVLPDIDHPDSLITHGILPGRRLFGRIGKILGWLLSLPPRIIGIGARATMNHRGGTHSVLFMLGWTLLAAPIYALLAGGVVYVLAIILQALAAVLPFQNPINSGAFAHWLWSNFRQHRAVSHDLCFLGVPRASGHRFDDESAGAVAVAVL